MSNFVNSPFGFRFLERFKVMKSPKFLYFRIYILLSTFFCYTLYHLSRKPISVVKSVLHENCGNQTDCFSWAPFDKSDYKELFGALDLAFLFSYAVGMFLSGLLSERYNIRNVLSIGMLGCGIFSILFGMGHEWNIHMFTFYIIVQIFFGLFQSTGWPCVVTCVGNWFGDSKRGIIFGVWNSHTSLGNILGSLLSGFFVTYNWSLSFILPGVLMILASFFVYLFFLSAPSEIGFDYMKFQNTTPHVSSSLSIKPNKPMLDSSCIESTSLVVPLLNDEASNFTSPKAPPPISFCNALKIPGVIEFSLSLFFAKLVAYTFLFWLPNYINASTNLDAKSSAFLSILFDIGGIIGGVAAGIISDRTSLNACICIVMLFFAAPVLYAFNFLFNSIYCYALLLLSGCLVNGPYALITTVISSELGLRDVSNSKAIATITSIIDGTGSFGAALGPLLTGMIAPSGWKNVFLMLILCDIISLLLLIRLAVTECKSLLMNNKKSEAID